MKKLLIFIASCLAMVIWFLVFLGSAQTISTFDVPGATITRPAAINDRGLIVGNSDLGGFVRDYRGNITVLPYIPTDINSEGDIVGYLNTQLFVDGHAYSFPFDVTLISQGLRTFQINDDRIISGFTFSDADILGVTVDPSFNFSTFQLPDDPVYGTLYPVPTALSQSNVIVGNTWPVDVIPDEGFIRDAQANVTIFAAVPPIDPNDCAVPSTDTYPVGISNLGYIAGVAFECFDPTGFIRDPQGNITLFPASDVAAMNDAGTTVGMLSDTEAFFRYLNGYTLTFPVPGRVTAINNRQEVVGYFSDSTGVHGYVLQNWCPPLRRCWYVDDPPPAPRSARTFERREF